MTARRPLTPLETLLQSRSQVPWWLYLLLALLSGLLLHWLGYRFWQGSVPATGGTLLHGFTLVGQVLLPLALLCAAVADLFNRLSRRRRVSRLQQEASPDHLLQQLSRQDVRALVLWALQAEGLLLQNGCAADGGILLRQGEEDVVLDLSCWRAPHLRRADLLALRERMTKQGVDGGLLVCHGRIDADARTLARRSGIRLIDRRLLQQWLCASVSRTAPQP
ncbi:restriction endonuclease [Pseudomonas sp.]|uniref:restriction endonuclease n=1 Tax=Pseudomonas sp. TaxID=306 RepID=UPI003CC684FD